jgi:hypothetical protein
LADVLKWLEKAKGGVFGSEVAELTLAYYRNKQQEQLTEAETRSLVADIMAAKK